MKTLIEIGKILKRRKQLRNAAKIALFFILISLLVVSFSNMESYGTYIFIFMFINYIAFILITVYTPQIETYEKFRYNIYCLNNSIKNTQDLERPILYLNNVAHNIETLVDEMKSLPFTEDTTTTLDKLRLFIKYDLYPSIQNQHDTSKNLVFDLDNIQKSIEENNFRYLQSIINNKNFEDINTSILLPYEKESTFKRYFALITRVLKKAFYESFVFRVTCIITILLIIGFMISNKSSTISFDTNLISALIILGSVIAQQMKQKD